MAAYENQLVAQQEEINSMKLRAKKAAMAHEKEIKAVLDSALIGGAAFGFGYIQGRYKDKAKVLNVPISAVAGGAIVVASLAGVLPADDKGGSEILAIGQGGIAAFGALKGESMGIDAANKAPATTN